MAFENGQIFNFEGLMTATLWHHANGITIKMSSLLSAIFMTSVTQWYIDFSNGHG